MHTNHSLVLKMPRFYDEATVIQIELEFKIFETGMSNVSMDELILKLLYRIKKLLKLSASTAVQYLDKLFV